RVLLVHQGRVERISTMFPYTTLFRSVIDIKEAVRGSGWSERRHIKDARGVVHLLFDLAQRFVGRIQRDLHRPHRTDALEIKLRHLGRDLIEPSSVDVTSEPNPPTHLF